MKQNRGGVGKALSFRGNGCVSSYQPTLDWYSASECFAMGRARPLPALATNRRCSPGDRLRALRLLLGLTLRDIHQESISLSKSLRNPEFLLPPSRLHEFETKSVIPSIHRLYTLAC